MSEVAVVVLLDKRVSHFCTCAFNKVGRENVTSIIECVCVCKMKHCFFFSICFCSFSLFSLFFGISSSEKRSFLSLLIFERRTSSTSRGCLHKISTPSNRNKKMFALTTQFAGVQVVSKTAAPKKSVNKVVSVRVFDC
jgi:hypothetical protein